MAEENPNRVVIRVERYVNGTLLSTIKKEFKPEEVETVIERFIEPGYDSGSHRPTHMEDSGHGLIIIATHRHSPIRLP